MGRMDSAGSNTIQINIPTFAGLNTDVQFSQIANNQSPDMANLLPGKTGSLSNRRGTVPVSDVSAADPLARVFGYRKAGVDSIVASGGTTLYKFNNSTLMWDAQAMTNALATANINAVQYRDDNANEVLVIADGGSLKEYTGTAVANITPAANETGVPDNYLATINANNPAVGVTIHTNRLVIWPYQKDIIYHSRPGFFDYFPTGYYQRFVRNNDYIQTCISFGSSLLVFMRHSVASLFGDGYNDTPLESDWSQDFLDTTDGCVNPRSVQIVVFPNGQEEVFYQTERGVSSVQNVDTKSLDNSTRLATRNVTADKVSWSSLGVTNAEWAAAASYFHDGFYWLVFKRGSEWIGLVYDPNTNEWFPIEGVRAVDFYADVNAFYFLGGDAVSGHLVRFDDIDYDVPSLVSNVVKDYDDAGQIVGVPVKWRWYSKLLNPALTGHKHLWDIFMLECRQFAAYSSIDVEINGLQGQYNVVGAVKTQFMIVGFSKIGEAEIANVYLTDFINMAKRLRVFLKSQYVQIKLSNSIGQPVELYNIVFEVRPQLTYSN